MDVRKNNPGLSRLKINSYATNKLVAGQNLNDVTGGIGKFNKFSAGTLAALNILASTNNVGATFNSNVSTSDRNISLSNKISKIAKKLAIPAVLVAGGGIAVATVLLTNMYKKSKKFDEDIKKPADDILKIRAKLIKYAKDTKTGLIQTAKKNKNSKVIKSIEINLSNLDRLIDEIVSCDFKDPKNAESFMNKIKELSKINADEASMKIQADVSIQSDVLKEEEFDASVYNLEYFLYEIAFNAISNNVDDYDDWNGLKDFLTTNCKFDSSCAEEFANSLKIAYNKIKNNSDQMDFAKEIHDELKISEENREKILAFLRTNLYLDNVKGCLFKYVDQEFASKNVVDICRNAIYAESMMSNRDFESFRRLFNKYKPEDNSASCLYLGPSAMVLRDKLYSKSRNWREVSELIGHPNENIDEIIRTWGYNTCNKWFGNLYVARYNNDYDNSFERGNKLMDFAFNEGRVEDLESSCEKSCFLYILHVVDQACTEAGFDKYGCGNMLFNILDGLTDEQTSREKEQYCLFKEESAKSTTWSKNKKEAFELLKTVAMNLISMDSYKCKNQLGGKLTSMLSAVRTYYLNTGNRENIEDKEFCVGSYFSRLFDEMREKVLLDDSISNPMALENSIFGAEYTKSLRNFLDQMTNVSKSRVSSGALGNAVVYDLKSSDVAEAYRNYFTVDLILDTVKDTGLTKDDNDKLRANWLNSTVNFDLLETLTKNRLSEDLKTIRDLFHAYLEYHNYEPLEGMDCYLSDCNSEQFETLKNNLNNLNKLEELHNYKALPFNSSSDECEQKKLEILNKLNVTNASEILKNLDDYITSIKCKYIYAYECYITSLLDKDISDVEIYKLKPVIDSISEYGFLIDFYLPNSYFHERNIDISSLFSSDENSTYIPDFLLNNIKCLIDISGNECSDLSIPYILELLKEGYLMFDTDASSK